MRSCVWKGVALARLSILTVCTGNICRSPLAEYFLRDALDCEHFEIASAGTHAVVGGVVPGQQINIAAKYGLETINEHRGRQISEKDIHEADLILTASLRHRRYVVRTVPAAANKSFTMREYAYLVSHVQESDLAELFSGQKQNLVLAVVAAHQLRGTVTRLSRESAYDVVDPYGENRRTYRKSADQLIEANVAIVQFLELVEGYEGAFAEATSDPPAPLNLRGKHHFN